MADHFAKIKVLSEQPRAMQVASLFVIPVAYGGITGLALGWDSTTYWVLLVLSVIGGLGAGFEHITARGGFIRGLIGSSLFSLGLVVAYKWAGRPAVAFIPENDMWIFWAANIVSGCLLGATGGVLRSIHKRRRATLAPSST